MTDKINTKKNRTAKIEVNSHGHFLVIGELNFSTIRNIQLRGSQLIAASPKPIFDFQHVIVGDNSAAALLTSWVRYAKTLNKVVLYIHLPKQLLDILEVSGLIRLLPIKQ